MMGYWYNDDFLGRGYYGMGYGGFNGAALAGWIIGILVIVLVIVGIIALVHYLQKNSTNNTKIITSAPDINNSLNILNERYARGEINDQEYTAKKAELRK